MLQPISHSQITHSLTFSQWGIILIEGSSDKRKSLMTYHSGTVTKQSTPLNCMCPCSSFSLHWRLYTFEVSWLRSEKIIAHYGWLWKDLIKICVWNHHIFETDTPCSLHNVLNFMSMVECTKLECLLHIQLPEELFCQKEGVVHFQPWLLKRNWGLFKIYTV